MKYVVEENGTEVGACRFDVRWKKQGIRIILVTLTSSITFVLQIG
jgi:hypothetical protein